MKFTVLLLAVTLLQAKASIFAQKINLSVKDASLTEVITKIRMQTQIDILYNNSAVSGMKPITLEAKNEDLKVVLNKCFKDQPLTYKMVGNTILITPKPEEEPAPVENEKPAAITITGRVVDEKGLPLPGVTVKVKNTKTAAASDINGNYKISVPDVSAVLVFSFVGYESQEAAVAGRTTINISLKAQNTGLNEIVVVGYGTQKSKDLTGSVSFVTAENMNKGPQLTPQQMLQGKAAGINIAQNSGKPGGSNTIRIRGGQSLTQSNEPLYVIDGVPIAVSNQGQSNIAVSGTDVFDEEAINPLQTLNANDIESISVLKDASAAAIYGARAANGVIIIVTKSGKNGKAQVSYNGSASVSNVAKELNMLSADQYRSLIKTLSLPIDDKGASTNWQDQIYRTAYSSDHNVALSGGTDKTSYRTSLGYSNQQGIVRSSSIEQANVTINLTHKALNDRLKFDFHLNYGQNKQHVAPISNTVGSELGTSMNYEAYVFNPTYPVYDPNGNYYNIPPYRVNPVSFSTEVTDQKANQRILGNLTTSYKILDPLSINVTLGYTRTGTDRNTYIDKSKGNSPLGNGLNGWASMQKFSDYSKLSETILRFAKTYGKHDIEALAGYSYQYFYSESSRITANNFLSDNFMWNALQAAGTPATVSSGAGDNKLISFYTRANYNYDSRYLVTATLRRDGSSRFGANNKWGYFPSGSVAWRISQEKFFKVKPISDLKLRASYGVTGNQDISNLLSQSLLSPSSTGYIIGGTRYTLIGPSQLQNPNIKWESTKQLDLGLNFALFNNRLHGTVDYYNKQTNDLLLSIILPQPTVITRQTNNVGSVENKGFEIELGGTIIDHKDFNWDANIVFSRNMNKVISLSNSVFKSANIQSYPVQGTVSGGNTQIIMPGQPLGTFYGPVYTGLNSSGMETYAPGGNQIIGNAQPNFTYGLSNTFRYKQFTLTANMRGSYGNKVYNLTANNLGYKKLLPGKNALASVVDDGVSASQPQTFSSRWIESGSFLRMDNATLGYDVKLKTAAISGLRVYLNAQNLFLITKYSGVDPEVNAETSRTGTAPLGIDYLGYPRARTFSMGVNLTFN
ncbi:TonB-dependent receptor [Mucilaginibacter yixingensis]|nr:TonB-dependent receptor [Mucilaginibacter yixingensis]